MIARLTYESTKIYRYKEHNAENEQELLLVAGKNDSVSFQLIFCPLKDSYGFGISGEPVFLASGAYESYRANTVISGADSFIIEQNIIGFNDDNNGTDYGDILLNDSHIFVENRNQVSAAFISIFIPKNCKSASFSGEVQIFCRTRTQDEQLIVSLPFEFTVFNKVVPDLTESDFFLDLWQHNCNIARKHEVRLWSDEHFKIIEKYALSLAALGQKSITAVASESPWNGQSPEYSREYISDFYEYSSINVIRSLSGNLSVDFTNFQRLLNIYLKCGIKDEIQVFGLMSIWENSPDRFQACCLDHPIKCRVRYFDEKTGAYCFLRNSKDIDFYISEVYRFFEQTQLLDIVRLASDEPHDAVEYQRQLDYYRRNFPRFKFKTAFSNGNLASNLSKYSSDCAVLLPELVKNLNQLKKNRETNGKLLFYTCGIPEHPNTFIRSPLLESRVIPLLAEYLQLDGYLRWSYTAWPQSPRTKLAYRWPSGDTCLVYPSKGGDVLLSLRYKNLQSGLKDAALLRMCDNKTKEKFFAEIFPQDSKSDSFNSSDTHFSSDQYKYSRAKQILL